jgi:hypothetical protein
MEKILQALDPHNLDMNAIDFACYANFLGLAFVAEF